MKALNLFSSFVLAAAMFAFNPSAFAKYEADTEVSQSQSPCQDPLLPVDEFIRLGCGQQALAPDQIREICHSTRNQDTFDRLGCFRYVLAAPEEVACQRDLYKYCYGVADGEQLACLRKHASVISKRCRRALNIETAIAELNVNPVAPTKSGATGGLSN